MRKRRNSSRRKKPVESKKRLTARKLKLRNCDEKRKKWNANREKCKKPCRGNKMRKLASLLKLS